MNLSSFLSLNLLQNNEEPEGDMEWKTGKISVHSSERLKSFRHKGRLQKPTGVHKGKKSFNCSVCKKLFNLEEALRSTWESTREKPFSFSVCSKGFTKRGNLRTHLLVHTEEKRFSCSFCSKRIVSKQAVKLHFLAHTGKKPFS